MRLASKVSAFAAAGAALAAVAVAGASPQKAAVAVSLKEFTVTPVPLKVKPGTVTFTVRNQGHLGHEFVVLKTNLNHAKLPQKGATAVEVGRVGKIPVFGPGSTKTLTLNLKAGRYVLICNVKGHYAAGQHVAFTVG